MPRKSRGRDERHSARSMTRIKDKTSCYSYLTSDANVPEFREQLNVLGLDLKEIPADGNCLFSALADQLTGSLKDHLFIREQSVRYIQSHKEYFTPFFDVSEDLEDLRSPGTRGGHECIMAVARNFNVFVVIHQLKLPPWLAGVPLSDCTIRKAKSQLHIAYHNGEHYSSVRVIGDVSDNPTCISIPLSQPDSLCEVARHKSFRQQNGGNQQAFPNASTSRKLEHALPAASDKKSRSRRARQNSRKTQTSSANLDEFTVEYVSMLHV